MAYRLSLVLLMWSCLWGWATPVLGVPLEGPYDELISDTARQYGLEPALVKAVVKCESRFDPWAQSPRGAQGLMQLMPATQAMLGVSDAFDPQRNVVAGVRYLQWLQHTFGGEIPLMLAGYNAGPQAVINAGYAIPPFAETQQYVRCVLQARQRYNQGEPPQPSARPPLHLKATALDRYGAVALINDQALTIGQGILGFTVVHIAVGQVELVRNGQKLLLTILNGNLH
jgi:hypothetical protein